MDILRHRRTRIDYLNFEIINEQRIDMLGQTIHHENGCTIQFFISSMTPKIFNTVFNHELGHVLLSGYQVVGEMVNRISCGHSATWYSTTKALHVYAKCNDARLKFHPVSESINFEQN